MLLEYIIHVVSVWQKQSVFAFRNCWTVGNCVLFSSRMCWDSTDPFQTKTTRQNNKVIRYSNMHYGQVEHFIIVETQCPPRYAGSFSKYLLCAIVNVIIIVAGMADVTRSTSHMHMVPLQSPTGKLAVVPWQDKCDVCVSANVYTSYLCCQAESKKSGITLWRVMQDNPCGSFTFDVLNYLYIIEINVGLLPINFFQFDGKTHLFSYFNCCAVHMVQKTNLWSRSL